MIAKYWALYTDEIDGFVDGVDGRSARRGRSTSRTREADAPVDAVIPSEGVTGGPTPG